MRYKFFSNPTFLFNAISIVTACLVINLFPLQKLTSCEYKDDYASKVPYYFTLQSLLASYPLLSSDKANIAFIKNKIIKFEKKITNPDLAVSIVNQYRKPYQHALENAGLKTVNTKMSEEQVIEFAHSIAPIIDSFYLDKDIYNQSVYYDWVNTTRRILRYNLNGLFDNKPDKYSPILMATNIEWITGSSAGHYIINQTEAIDTRFMAALPLLSALYLLPRTDYTQSGSYRSPAQDTYFTSGLLTDPLVRKVLDVSGVDIFTLHKADFEKYPLSDTHSLPTKINPRFGDLFTVKFNERSYGLAYFANSIKYADKKDIQGDEKRIKKYLRIRKDPSVFNDVVNKLNGQLLQLKNKHDVILESKDLDIPNGTMDKMVINGIVGERASFTTNCLQQNCLFVFNVADVPGWHAYYNGVKTKIYRANYAFMAADLPKGEGSVWFIYSSAVQLITYFMSAGSLLLIIIVSLAQHQRRYS